MQENYIRSRNYINFQEIIFIQANYIRSRNYIHFKEIIFIQGKYIHSRNHLYSKKTNSFREIYLLKEIIFIQVQGNMFIQENYTHSTTLRSRTQLNIYSTSFPNHFIVIISLN